MASTTFTSGTVVASSWLNDVNDFVYGWRQYNTVSVLKFIPTNLHASIIAGTNNTDLAPYLQDAFDSIKTTGGALYFHGLTYRCDTALDWRCDASPSPNTFHYAFIGDGAVLDFRDTLLTTGAAIRVGATSQANTTETGKIIVQGLIVLGPDDGAITDSNARATSLTGISFEYCINLVLDSLHTLYFYKGYKTEFCFPIDARSVIAQSCTVGLHIGSDCTTGMWTACGFRNGRFGILIQPDTTSGACYGQTFQSPNLEGNYVGAALDPLSGSGVGIWNMRFISPYIEAITLDAFRLGTVVDLSNAGSVGSDTSRDIHSIVWEGGTWDAGGSIWGSTNHDAIRGPTSGSSAKPYSLVIQIPVPDTGLTLVGCKDVTVNGFKDPATGTTATNVHALGGQCFVRADATGSTGAKTMRVAKNVTSFTKNGTGEYTVAFSRSFKASDSYVVAASAHGTAKLYAAPFSTSTTDCVIRVYNDAGTLTDPSSDLSVMVFGSE